MNIRALLDARVRAAMTAAGVAPEFNPVIAPSKKREFGDYQANGAMAAAKAMAMKPRDLALAIADKLDLEGIAERVEIAGPGFINIHLNPAWLSESAQRCSLHPRLGIEPVAAPDTVVIDYSSPNLAKEMHVGHLRSTIIGDTLARLLEFLGHCVIRQNHVGDWGTQFGMLIAELESHLAKGEQAEFALHDLEAFYLQAKTHFDSDPDFAQRARNYVVKLQSGDAGVLQLWQRFRDISLQHSEEIYQRLNISLGADDVRGESAYNEMLPKVISDLEQKNLVHRDQGALVVYLEELADKEGNPSVVIVQKQDGGYLYSTSDLAAVHFRQHSLAANRIMIFVDARQSLHLQQVFLVARKLGYAKDDTRLEHHPFGTMLGPNGTPFKTRDGGTVKLAHLVEEAIERAGKLVAEKNPGLSDELREEVARKVGVGAVKYADLSKTRTNDYVFSWEAMLSFEGNTAPYLQYAFTRIQSIFRNSGSDSAQLSSPIVIETAEERALALRCLQLSEVLEQVAQDAFPHVLCSYLYDVASLFMSFYENCPILKEGISRECRESRLGLCHFTARTLEQGLQLLGIEVMERM